MVNGKRTGGGGDDGKSTKRSRVSRACDQCRSSRERCDGEPKCQTCVSQNRTCTYNAQPKKRGIQPNYIRTLELTLAWLLQTFPEAETQLAEYIPQDRHRLTGLLRGKDSEATEALHLAWRTSLICKQIDQLLSGEHVETDGQYLANHAGTGVDRSNSELLPYQSPPLSVPLEQSALQHGVVDIEMTSGASRVAVPTENLQNWTSHHGLVKLPDNALMLLEHYFAFTHAWLPMTEKHSILKLLYSYPNEGLFRNQLVGAEHAELWSIMALAAVQLSEEAHRDHTRHIRDVAQELIPTADANASYEVPHIRAMMLLALIDASEQRMLAAWLRIGTVVSLLLLFKILERLNVTEKWCRHIHLAAFVVESAIASHLQVPAHLRVSYIETIGLVDEDGLDEYETWQDPLDTARQGSQKKAPSRSFSTLNELVRRFMHSPGSDPTGYPPRHGSASGDSTIVFSLLKNASSKRSRIQPSVLVATFGKQDSQTSLAAQSSADLNSTVGGSTALNQALANIDWKRQQAVNANEFQDHISSFPFPGTLHVSDAGGQLGTAFWTSSPSVSQTADLGTTLGDSSMPGADIFEQFDALERQDSNQHSQFYQNLGFAPDVELAEFFGEDYQPSDPLLAYLNPTLYGLNKGSGASVPETG